MLSGLPKVQKLGTRPSQRYSKPQTDQHCSPGETVDPTHSRDMLASEASEQKWNAFTYPVNVQHHRIVAAVVLQLRDVDLVAREP
jgi:hypothetical protein